MKTNPTAVLVIAGTRPEAIKLAPVILALRDAEGFEVQFCTTGQHRDLLDQVLDLFELQPDVDLSLMRPGQSLNQLASRAIEALGQTMRKLAPDWVIVQGDTTTAFAGALAAFHLGHHVAHLEAGLRSWDLANPFPEEANRKMVTCIADLHLAPTQRARENLLSEAVPPERIEVTGNTVIDAIQWVAARTDKAGPGNQPGDPGVRRILLTVHRRENHGAPLHRIIQAVRQLASAYLGKIEFVMPVHPNPDVYSAVQAGLGHAPGVLLTDPLRYDQLVGLMDSSYLVLTDSGGIQEEAPGLGKPVLVLRETTERPEGLEAGVARLVGTDTETIVEAVSLLLDDGEVYRQMARASNPYGEGDAAHRVVHALKVRSQLGGKR